MTMNIVRNLARYLMGIVFIFSGFVKAIDPMGSTYKFMDYFEAFGLDFLSPMALALSILLSCAELTIGLCLFLKIRMKEASWALLLFMSFFTPLTFGIALTNPVSDCGCFGDAIILTNWQTFFKNLIFIVPTLIVFRQRKNYLHIIRPSYQWYVVIVFGLSTLLLSLHSYFNLPFIDFRPYHIGANIPASMKIPEGMPTDEYETILVYEKDGIIKEFTLDSEMQPWNDTSWNWVETKNMLVKSGYKPPVHDFSLTSFKEDYNITDSILADKGYSFLIVTCDLEKTNCKGLERMNEFAAMAIHNNYKVYGMTSSTNDVLDELKAKLNLAFDFYITDNITLKTMIRSDPGLMLLKEGTVIGKWHYRNIPPDSFFNEDGLSFCMLETARKKNDYFELTVVLFIGFISSILGVFRTQQLKLKK